MSEEKPTRRKRSAEAKDESGGKKKTELQQTVADIHKHKSPHHLISADTLIPFNHIPTGAFTLDLALGGGILEGLSTTLYGVPSCGKTTLSDKIIASVQNKYPDRTAVMVDLEKTFDADWAKRQGVDTKALLMAQPDSGEEAVDMIAALMDTWETSLIVVDSIPAMVAMQVIEKSAEDKTMSPLARLMGILCSKIVTSWSKERKRGHWVTLVFTNQFRSKIGMFYGDPRTLPGGAQINHLSTTKVEIKNKEIVETDGDKMLDHNDHSFKITKGKTGASIRSGEFQMAVNSVFSLPSGLVLEEGLPTGTFLDAATVATYARKFELITGAGSSWHIKDVDQKFGKLPEIENFLYTNEPEFLRLRQRVISAHRLLVGLPALPPDGYLLDYNAKENIEGVFDVQ